MMGSAMATGPDRARIAAEQAVASPLLEDVNLANARGVLVNITASSSFKMKEYYDVMNTIKEFTAEDATVIVGNVFDESIGDGLRVTMVATGLDPKSLSVPEVAFFRRVPQYLEAAEGFASGTPEGVRAWLLFCCEAFEAGAREAKSISDAAT